jgi:transcriptional regulator with XRE-family HTH domain
MSQSARWLIAKNIKNLRKQAKLNREELSLALGFDNSYISKLERSKINITIDKLEIIANYFDIEISEIFKNK